jgi:galactokinase/mevalonate kinase-like predicted kinase
VKYTARAPLRIDLAGTWTCIPNLGIEEEGAATCVAITRYAEGSISLPWGDGPLMRWRSDRRHVEYSLSLPIGAGLGASAAQTVLWVALMRSVIDNAADRGEVARSACDMQRLIGTLEGPQNAYASAHGGITCHSVGETVTTDRVIPPPALRADLEGRFLLVWSGERGRSREVAAHLREHVAAGDAVMIEGLRSLRRMAVDMAAAAHGHDADAVVRLADEHSRLQATLLPESRSNAHQDLESMARRFGAVAYKPCGIAGGAGLVLTASGDAPYLAQRLGELGVRVFDAAIDTYGVHLRKA